ncbi:3-isopropylmalate dehydratase small subunit [Bradyrhizobium sp. U87765 SZCCT0131]|uniref:3-isopropylmalate dehydratase small subunit n=1 Tax=unclassified Bradyrhizobium TaxID=2631580 RepID=UPI001BA80196|nr:MULTISPECIES: 3-isopropylmalate dehydratase small subunit [unclassified Bradyrhizobium]MBR1221988.1 3-isopropylmalate dehydratase small subunit [Bradyrhizobium sp. U87765 SZCCT0131]MBR1263814.1 3-isopropylmalate dehydratase small subunit [Bradyrhizobium sp. U87765 SZCCT0134]MBR1302616.1 3-isopropylmalate dehydratase small subunit [Bradyrhizobium sp. U87765 SZCCT0110]MBR1320064.1 3-isopropylmalate dehydratase small subunit [Bradyrhizobium sp. U87765 SZCCT0109]MBR1348823.1 3-isopropylmalate d
MQPFVTVSGPLAALPAANIDTDVIMPKQFLKGIDRSGLRDGLFFDLRRDPDFILNRAGFTEARFLAVGPNFGCGSSREHAVWGLAQFGIRALIGSSFAGIFSDNCARNGVLTVSLDADSLAQVFAAAGDATDNTITIDLPTQTIARAAACLRIPFAIDALQKDALLTGTDAVGATLRDAEAIRSFETAHFAASPWLA